jgi:hypothetical protein
VSLLSFLAHPNKPARTGRFILTRLLPLLFILGISSPVAAGWKCSRLIGSPESQHPQRIDSACQNNHLSYRPTSCYTPCAPVVVLDSGCCAPCPSLLPTLSILDSPSTLPPAQPASESATASGAESGNIGATGAAVRAAALDSTNLGGGTGAFGGNAFGGLQGFGSGGIGGSGSGGGGGGIGGAGLFLPSDFSSTSIPLRSVPGSSAPPTNPGINPSIPGGRTLSPITDINPPFDTVIRTNSKANVVVRPSAISEPEPEPPAIATPAPPSFLLVLTAAGLIAIVARRSGRRTFGMV